ncbi:MAG TPA: hypothetical protein VLW85_14770 [Myxococcales bacterium]|nr:hypothetical protein [Myxococcales bacterium]
MKVQLALIALALAACGGDFTPGSPNQTADAYVSAAPTFDKFAIAQNDSDTATPSAAPQDSSSQALTTAGAECHPHLFERTGEIISHVNRHFYKMIVHVEDLIKNNPELTSGESKTWENVKNGIDRKLVLTLNADGSFTYVLTLSNGTTTATVLSGNIDTTTTGTVTETKGQATFDFSALASVVVGEQSTGQVTDAFDIVKDTSRPAGEQQKRTAQITLTAFHFDDDAHGPRNGSYTWEREPGVGGKFQFTDDLVLLCPSNPSGLVASMTSVARWYNASGSVHARSDSKATGGQIVAGNTWEGVTCAQGSTATAPAEGFWMMKLEDSSGATVVGAQDQLGDAPCDPVFGAVPDLNDNANDYDFTAAVTFPNEW